MIPTAAVEEMVVELKRLINAPRDLRVGGEYRIRVNSKTCGGATELSGIYREVERPSRLDHTWGWSDPRLDAGQTLVTVDFVDVNGDTEVRLGHEGFPTPEHRDNHNYGWSASVEKLEKLFRNKQNKGGKR